MRRLPSKDVCMSDNFVYIFMLFMHVFDDYVLQSFSLVNLKQINFWKQHAPEKKYENDYSIALYMHGMSWAFCVMLPIAIYYGFNVGRSFFILFWLNSVVHAIIDHLKANRKMLNLYQDQVLHLLQLAITYFILM